MASVCVLEGITEDTMWRVLSVVFQGLGQAGLSVSRWEDTYTLLTDYNYVPACRTLGTNVRVQLGVYVCACTCAISLPPYDIDTEREISITNHTQALGSRFFHHSRRRSSSLTPLAGFHKALSLNPPPRPCSSCAPLDCHVHEEKEKSLLFLTVIARSKIIIIRSNHFPNKC